MFSLIFAVLLVVGAPVYVYRSLSELRSGNEAMRDLLRKMSQSQDLLLDRKHHHDQLLMRYLQPAPSLASFIEKAAQENQLEVPESKDRPEVPHGKRYTERVTQVTMRKIGMAQLVKTLEKIDTSGYPVAITRLNIKKRSGAADMWDVELSVSAFDRKADKKEDGAATAGSASPASSGSAASGEEGAPL